MAELKTKETAASVKDFFSEIADEKVRQDCEKISALRADGKSDGRETENVGRVNSRFWQSSFEIRSGARS